MFAQLVIKRALWSTLFRFLYSFFMNLACLSLDKEGIGMYIDKAIKMLKCLSLKYALCKSRRAEHPPPKKKANSAPFFISDTGNLTEGYVNFLQSVV